MRRYLPGILFTSLVLLTLGYGVTVVLQRRALEHQDVSVTVRTTDPVLGSRSAPVTIVVFGDFQCEACRDFDTTLRQVVASYGDRVRLVWKDFPLRGTHADAQAAAEAARCAQDQGKFWEMHDALYANIVDLPNRPFTKLAADIGLDAQSFASCLERNLGQSRIDENLLDGQAIGITGTPTVIVDSLRYQGIPTAQELVQVIDQELAR